jgi:hypothetical protein
LIVLAFPQAVISADSEQIDHLLNLMQGEFRNDHGSLAEGEPVLQDRRIRVDAPQLGEYVVYMQVNSGKELKVYRQRLLVFTRDPDGGTVLQHTWAFKNPDRFVDGFEKPELFRDVGPEDLELTLPEGCIQKWTVIADGWSGRVDPETCLIWSERRQSWRRIGAELKLTPGLMLQAERGFDEDGKQVFGTPPGDLYELPRIKLQP